MYSLSTYWWDFEKLFLILKFLNKFLKVLDTKGRDLRLPPLWKLLYQHLPLVTEFQSWRSRASLGQIFSRWKNNESEKQKGGGSYFPQIIQCRWSLPVKFTIWKVHFHICSLTSFLATALWGWLAGIKVSVPVETRFQGIRCLSWGSTAADRSPRLLSLQATPAPSLWPHV